MKLHGDELAVAGGQSGEGGADGRAPQRDVGPIVRPGGLHVLRVGDEGRKPPAAAQLVERRVARNPEEPGPLLAPAAIERPAPAVGSLEGERSHVLGRRAVVQEGGHVGVDVIAARAVERFEAPPGVLPMVGLRRGQGLAHELTTALARFRHGDAVAQSSHPADIFLAVRSRLLSLLLVAAAVAGISAPGVAAASKPSKAKKTHHKKKGPTEAQKIQAAVKSAERSPDLWATVNVCTSTPTQDTVGIRGQMPSLGITATLLMNLSVSYWNGSTFAPVPANPGQPTPGTASDSLSLGQGTHGIHQGGVNFNITPPASGSTYVVRGTITFEWKVGSKVVGTVTRNTGHGYANVGFGNPPGYSAGTCTLT